MRYVRLYVADGRKKRLRAPTTGFMARDPHFDAKAATIDQWWKHYTGQLGPPAAAQGSGDLGVPTDA